MDLNFQELFFFVTPKLVARLTEESRHMLCRNQPATLTNLARLSRATCFGATLQRVMSCGVARFLKESCRPA